MATHDCWSSSLPYPNLIIDPEVHLSAYLDLNDNSVPKTENWDLNYNPAHDIGHISVREKGGAVFQDEKSGLFKVCVFQRSSWHAIIYPWNIVFTIKEDDGRFIIRHIELCEKVKGARGELCRRDYLYWNLRSNLIGRAFDHSLLAMNQALRIQCTHIVELIRYGVGSFLRAIERKDINQDASRLFSGQNKPKNKEKDAGHPKLLYSESEITRVFRVKENDIFYMVGTQKEYCPGDSRKAASEGKLQYQLSIPAVKQALGQTLSGSVKIKPFTCCLLGNVGGKKFRAAREVPNMNAMDNFVLQTIQVNPLRIFAGNLKDVAAYLSLGQLFDYPFNESENRTLYKKIVKKNSFCIGWRPNLIDEKVLAAINGDLSFSEFQLMTDNIKRMVTDSIAVKA